MNECNYVRLHPMIRLITIRSFSHIFGDFVECVDEVSSKRGRDDRIGWLFSCIRVKIGTPVIKPDAVPEMIITHNYAHDSKH